MSSFAQHARRDLFSPDAIDDLRMMSAIRDCDRWASQGFPSVVVQSLGYACGHKLRYWAYPVEDLGELLMGQVVYHSL